MSKLLIVVDMQNDFISGSLGSAHAMEIVPAVKSKIAEYRRDGNRIIFTKDTHDERYPETQEGEKLPVAHCVKNTAGHEIVGDLDAGDSTIFEKGTFGSLELAEFISRQNEIEEVTEIELCGLCTDICVVSNALILKAKFPETPIVVDAGACAGVTEEGHAAALLTMKMCQINVTAHGEKRR